MSFYRYLLVGFTVAAFAMPVLAVETTTGTTQSSYDQSQPTDTAIELTENGPVTPTTTTTPTSTDTTKSTATSNDTTQGTSTQSTSTATTTTETKVNLNTATVKELVKVKGLNAAKAKAIVAFRKKHGDFKSISELNQVKGFKKMKDTDLKKITDQLEI